MHDDWWKERGVPSEQVHALQVKVAGWRRSHANATPAEVEGYAGTLADEVTAVREGADKPDPPKRKR